MSWVKLARRVGPILWAILQGGGARDRMLPVVMTETVMHGDVRPTTNQLDIDIAQLPAEVFEHAHGAQAVLVVTGHSVRYRSPDTTIASGHANGPYCDVPYQSVIQGVAPQPPTSSTCLPAVYTDAPPCPAQPIVNIRLNPPYCDRAPNMDIDDASVEQSRTVHPGAGATVQAVLPTIALSGPSPPQSKPPAPIWRAALSHDASARAMEARRRDIAMAKDQAGSAKKPPAPVLYAIAAQAAYGIDIIQAWRSALVNSPNMIVWTMLLASPGEKAYSYGVALMHAFSSSARHWSDLRYTRVSFGPIHHNEPQCHTTVWCNG